MDSHEGWQFYDVPEGRVWAAIRPAVLTEYWADEGGWLALARCLVELTSDPPGTTGTPGYLTVHRARYRVRTCHERLTYDREWSRGDGTTVRWCSGPVPTRGGFRTESGQLIGWGTAAIERLSAIEADVLDRFEAEYPDWQRASERLGLLTDKAQLDDKAQTLHREFVAANEKAAELDRRLKSL